MPGFYTATPSRVKSDRLLVSPILARTTDGPLKPVADAARQMEANGTMLHASIFPVQPWIDVPGLGFAALVCAERDARVARDAAERSPTTYGIAVETSRRACCSSTR